MVMSKLIELIIFRLGREKSVFLHPPPCPKYTHTHIFLSNGIIYKDNFILREWLISAIRLIFIEYYLRLLEKMF